MRYKHKFELQTRPGCVIFVQTPKEISDVKLFIPAIKKRWFPPNHFYHFKRGGHVSALRRHVENQYFAKLDMQNFYNSISRNRVQRVLKRLGFSLADAQIIAQRSCVLLAGRRVLPFGYVQSPLLASIVLDNSALGREIDRLRKAGVTITVFMDDILLSHNDRDALEDGYSRLVAAAVEAKFDLSPNKMQPPAESVTVFNIDMECGGMAISPERFEEFSRRVLNQSNSNVVLGVLGYVATVNDDQHLELRELAKI